MLTIKEINKVIEKYENKKQKIIKECSFNRDLNVIFECNAKILILNEIIKDMAILKQQITSIIKQERNNASR